MRVFPDTNVLLSAFFGNGLCEELFARLLKSKHILLIGEPVAREFVRIAKMKFRVGPPDLAYALEVLRRQQTVSAVTNSPKGIPDPNDTPIIGCALAARADVFVTGDKALLELVKVEGMPILSPRQLWEKLNA